MKTITQLSELDPNAHYSYADYLQWRLSQAVELIRGKVFPMSPAPSALHQRISWNLTGLFFNYLEGKPCQAFAAPFDVRLTDSRKAAKAHRDIGTVVQPDLCVVCDAQKIDELGCLGAPDLIVEILSKGNSKKEIKNKYRLYEENGVREYWIVFPYEHVLEQLVLNAEGLYYLHARYAEDEVVESVVFENLHIPLGKVFPQ